LYLYRATATAGRIISATSSKAKASLPSTYSPFASRAR
jgi:hypothetical protein